LACINAEIVGIQVTHVLNKKKKPTNTTGDKKREARTRAKHGREKVLLFL